MLQRFALESETLAQARLAAKKPSLVFQLLIFLGVMLVSSGMMSILIGLPLGILWGLGMGAGESWYTLLALLACAAEIAVPIIYCVCLERRPARSMGCRKRGWLREYLLGFAAGAAALCAAAGLAAAFGTMSFRLNSGVSWGMLIPFLLGFLIQGAGEEFMLRGYFMVSLANRVPLAAAVGISAVVFALLHLGNDGATALAIVNLTLFGVLAGAYMLRRDSIWGACAFHSAWNFFQGNVLGVQVSGGSMGPSLFSASVGGSDLITGGSFGLEGGLAATAALTAGIALVLLLPRKGRERTIKS
ncbi:MAG: CPBP family intramembrane metalloprotease [Oscillospiraceae bacterium]|nr:CPBP family intramembrane metalloprotease [Oscillospiraceae bacterium]